MQVNMCVCVHANICVCEHACTQAAAHVEVGLTLGVGCHFLSCLRQGLFVVVHGCVYQESRPVNLWGAS